MRHEKFGYLREAGEPYPATVAKLTLPLTERESARRLSMRAHLDQLASTKAPGESIILERVAGARVAQETLWLHSRLSPALVLAYRFVGLLYAHDGLWSTPRSQRLLIEAANDELISPTLAKRGLKEAVKKHLAFCARVGEQELQAKSYCGNSPLVLATHVDDPQELERLLGVFYEELAQPWKSSSPSPEKSRGRMAMLTMKFRKPASDASYSEGPLAYEPW